MSLENSLVMGRYRVLWPLESKKLIKTYIATDEHRDGLGTPVLIKHYLHDLGDKESQPATALFEELGRLTSVRHTGIVSLLDYGTVEQCLVTAHAHVQGMDLSQLCDVFSKKHEQFSPQLAVFIARRLLDTLHHCHTRASGSLMHGRLTLGCIYLPTNGEPQISDFGLASLEEVAAEAEMQLGFFQTRMSYSAPELTRGGAATPQGDTYSVALLLYRILAGSNPFRGRSIPETLQRVLQHAPAELHMPAWKNVGEANQILKRALDKNPEARFQNCLDLYQALGGLQRESDDKLREELAALVRRNATGDWAQIARLTRSVRRSMPPPVSAREGHRLLVASPLESKAPAFVSGLVTEQPISAAEHTQGARREASREKHQRRRQVMMLPTVLLPAIAIMFGLFLGRLGGAGNRASAARQQATVQAEAPPLVNAQVEEVRQKLRRCVTDRNDTVTNYKVELEFSAGGELSGVKLAPRELSHSRLGACLLETAWEANLRTAGSVAIMIPLDKQ